MTDLEKEILDSALSDAVATGEIIGMYPTWHLETYQEVRRAAIAAVRSLVEAGLAQIGSLSSAAPGGVEPWPLQDDEALRRYQMQWETDGDTNLGQGRLKLTPNGQVIARQVVAERHAIERSVVEEVARRVPQIVAGLPASATLSLKELAREAASGEPPSFRGTVPVDVLAGAFKALEELYQGGDADTRRVIATGVIGSSNRRLAAMLGPGLLREHEAYERLWQASS